MRDFDAIKKKEMSSIENRIRHIYNVGYEDCLKDQQQVKDEAYKHGLEDAWECCKRIIKLSPDMQEDIFNMSGDHFIFDAHSADEAIYIIKRYDEKQNCIERCCKNCKHSENGMIGNKKMCEVCYYDEVSKGNTLFEPMEKDNSKIEVGDEVYVPDLNEYAIVIEMVSDDDGDFVRIIRSNGKPRLLVKDTVNLTGNHCDSIVDLLKRLEKRNA